MRKWLMAGFTAVLGVALAAVSPQTSQALSKADLGGAPVPSVCDYPAGTLVDGHLPGTDPGNVDLDVAHSRLGNLVKHGGTGAVAVLHCSQGGVGWPDHAVFYDQNRRIIGHLDAGSIGYYSGRAVVSGVTIRKRVVTITLGAVGQQGDSDLWGSAGARLTYAYDAKKGAMTRRSSTIYRESVVAKKLLSMVRSGKLTQARKLATSDVVNGLRELAQQDRRSRDVWVTFGGCVGFDYSSDADSDRDVALGERACLYLDHERDADGTVFTWAYSASFTHPSGDWTRWQASEWQQPAGE